jgi:succinate dehydrogenase hydrophobic anchor subunit
MYPIIWSVVVTLITGSLGLALGLNSLASGTEEWIRDGFSALAMAILPIAILLMLFRSLSQTRLTHEVNQEP